MHARFFAVIALLGASALFGALLAALVPLFLVDALWHLAAQLLVQMFGG